MPLAWCERPVFSDGYDANRESEPRLGRLAASLFQPRCVIVRASDDQHLVGGKFPQRVFDSFHRVGISDLGFHVRRWCRPRGRECRPPNTGHFRPRCNSSAETGSRSRAKGASLRPRRDRRVASRERRTPAEPQSQALRTRGTRARAHDSQRRAWPPRRGGKPSSRSRNRPTSGWVAANTPKPATTVFADTARSISWPSSTRAMSRMVRT